MKIAAIQYERNELAKPTDKSLVRFTLDLESEGLKSHTIPGGAAVKGRDATKTKRAISARKAYAERYVHYVNIKSEIGKLRLTLGRNIYVKAEDAEGVSHLTVNIDAGGVTFGEVEKPEPKGSKAGKAKSADADFEALILKKLIAKGDEKAIAAFFVEAKGYSPSKSKIMATALA